MIKRSVTRSLDWRSMTPEQLHGHRFIALTTSGQTLDGWLTYHQDPLDSSRYLADSDHIITVFATGMDGKCRIATTMLAAINVLDEVRPEARP